MWSLIKSVRDYWKSAANATLEACHMSRKVVQIGATGDTLSNKKRQVAITSCQSWCYKRARQDSNLQPSDSKSATLSNWATGAENSKQLQYSKLLRLLSIPKELKMSRTSNLCQSVFTLATILFNTLFADTMSSIHTVKQCFLVVAMSECLACLPPTSLTNLALLARLLH